MKSKIFALMFCFCLVPCSLLALDLGGSVDVTQTSDTAAKAKINATNIARRQILSGVLSKYSDKDTLNDLLEQSSNEDLVNLISSSSVSNEQISSTDYSAKILMNIDNVAAKKWLDEHNVQNWVPIAESYEKFSLFIVVPNGIPDWAELKRIARENETEIETQNITGYQIVAKMPLNARNRFTIALREAGWKYADNGGVLQIWK